MRYLSILFLATLFFSCNNLNKKENSSQVEKLSKYKASKLELAYDELVSKIDMDSTLGIVNTLLYTKEDGSSYEVQAFIDENKQFHKIIENYTNGNNLGYGKTFYYYLDGIKIVTRELYEEKLDSITSKFVERITYYDDKGKVKSAKYRQSEREDDIEFLDFFKTKSNGVKENRVMRALNQEGEFATNFDGFVLSNNSRYLTVSSSDKNGYVSALMVQYEDNNIGKLIKNEAEMIGTPLEIGFEKMMDQAGFEFQVLMFAKIKDK